MIWYDLLEESQCQKRKFDRSESLPPTHIMIKDSSSAMMDKAEQELGEPLKEVSADAGYSQDTVIKKT